MFRERTECTCNGALRVHVMVRYVYM